MRNERNQVKNKIKLVMNIEKWNVKNENKEGKTYLYCKTRRTKEPKKRKHDLKWNIKVINWKQKKNKKQTLKTFLKFQLNKNKKTYCKEKKRVAFFLQK